ncbi:MAG: hypothetical protein ACOC1T_03670 [Halorhodospira sp.]
MAIEIRKLKASDVWQVAPVVADELQLIQQLYREQRTENEIGMAILHRLVERHLDRLRSWLADLAGMTPEELDEQSLDAPFEIIDQLRKSEDLPRFFERVRRVVGSSSETA